MRTGSSDEIQRSEWPQGDRSEMSRCVTDLKQEGTMKRSRALPRSVRQVRVERSRWSHFRHTNEVELRLRVSEIVAIMFERITSGRSLSVVA